MEATATAPTRYARSGSDLLNEIRQPVLTDLSRALRRAFAAVIDEMLEQLLREKDWDKRQSIDDGLDLLRNGREGIEIRFDRACTESWDRRTRRTDGPAIEARPIKYQIPAEAGDWFLVTIRLIQV